MITLVCKTCSKARKVYPSQIGLRYKCTAETYHCRSCWDSRKRTGLCNRKPATVNLTCVDCGKTKCVTPSRLSEAAKSYRCRTCFEAMPRKAPSPRKRPPTVMVDAKCSGCGNIRKIASHYAGSQNGKCLSCKNRGARNGSWSGGMVQIACGSCGKARSVRRNVAHKNRSRQYRCRACDLANRPSGVNSPTWRGGTSFEPYPTQWTAKLRQSIRDRDGNKCFWCGGQNKTSRKLPVHHVDYDKTNISHDNLVTLCMTCHPKTNFNRPYWQRAFQSKLSKEVVNGSV